MTRIIIDCLDRQKRVFLSFERWLKENDVKGQYEKTHAGTLQFLMDVSDRELETCGTALLNNS